MLLFVLGVPVAYAAGTAGLTGLQVSQIPVHERFVVEKNLVLESRDISTTTVEYAYIGKVSVPEKDEIFELRTQMSKTKKVGDENVTTFTGSESYLVDDVWHDLQFATTTKKAYQLQKKRVIPFVGAAEDIYTSSTTWEATSCDLTIEAFGGGGSGEDAGANGGGGGGGAYAKTNSVPAIKGTTYTITVGLGGVDADGGDSGFDDNSLILAKGGKMGASTVGGLGGLATESIGDTKFRGGNGSDGDSAYGGGGGGGGAGDAAQGGDTTGTRTGGTGGSDGGGNGGTGGDFSNGTAGSTLGGGGGGSDNSQGGDGARGELRITYTVNEGCGPTVTTSAATSILQTSATLNGEVTATNTVSNFAIGFEYGIDSFDLGVFSATTTVETATSSIGVYSASVSSLTTFEEYGFRSYSSTTDGIHGYGSTFQFYTADISTSTPVLSGDNHSWDLSVFDDGTHSTTTTDGNNLTLAPQ